MTRLAWPGAAAAQHNPAARHGAPSGSEALAAGETRTLKPGMPAPDLELADHEGIIRRLSDYRRHFVYRDGSIHQDIAFHTELLIDRTGAIRAIKAGWTMPVDFLKVSELLGQFSSYSGP